MGGRGERLALRRYLHAISRATAQRPVPRGNWLVRNKDALSALQAIATTLALLLAFVWFQGQHQAAPKLNIEQKLSQRPYQGENHQDGEVLVAIQIWLTNVGSISDYLEPGQLYIDEINPAAKRRYCETITDTNKTVPCGKPYTERTRGAKLMERLQRSTFLGWFWRPTSSSSRWIEPGERDQSFAGEFRFGKSTKTIRVSSVWTSGSGGYWKAIDYFDLSSAFDKTETQK